MHFYINEKPKAQTVLGDTFALQNKNYLLSTGGGERFQLLPSPQPPRLILDTALNPAASSGFVSFSLTNILLTSLPDLEFGRTKGFLSEGWHHTARKGVSLIKGKWCER